VNIFERVIQGSIFRDIWRQVREQLFSEKKWYQLLTLKPIEIYTTQTNMEIDGAKVDLDIKAYIENIVRKRIANVKNYLSLDFLSWTNNHAAYKFKIIIKAKTDYKSVGNFFNHHFANEKYDIEENKYAILLKEFIVNSSNNAKAQIEIPFIIYANKWYLKKQYEGKAIFLCSLMFDNATFTIKTRNLSYTTVSKSLLIKWIDRIYHQKIIAFLDSFLVYDYKEELYLAKLHAQEELDSFQVDKSWIHGNILDLDLEQITIDYDALRGVFLANGKLEVNR
jgi:hypothetical protein